MKDRAFCVSARIYVNTRICTYVCMYAARVARRLVSYSTLVLLVYVRVSAPASSFEACAWAVRVFRVFLLSLFRSWVVVHMLMGASYVCVCV